MKSKQATPNAVLAKKEEILDERFNKNIPAKVIAERFGFDSCSWAVVELIDNEWERRTNEIKLLLSSNRPCKEELVNYVRTARLCYTSSYFEIARDLCVEDSVIYDVIFYNRVTPGSRGYTKNSFNRAEKHRRNSDMIKLNQEGMTLAAIATKFHITKQRVSILLKEAGYVPVNTHTLKSIAAGKYADKFKECASDTLADQIDELRKEVRTTKQRNAVSKYHYNKVIMDLRCKLIMQYMINWSEEVEADYKANRRILHKIYNEGKNSPQYTKEVAKIRETLIRVDTFEKVNKIRIEDGEGIEL